MHYPLAMLFLALMDQRASKEPEEPGPLQQNKAKRGRGQRAGRWRRRPEKEEVWGGDVVERVIGSRLCECRQLDPPERSPQREEDMGVIKKE